MVPVSAILALVNDIAPFELAEEWDNVGLLAGHPDWKVERAMVALDLTPGERALILALGLLLLAAELINTAIEEVVDHISPGPDPRAKKAKDCGSACVALAALAGGVAWVVVLVG